MAWRFSVSKFISKHSGKIMIVSCISLFLILVVIVVVKSQTTASSNISEVNFRLPNTTRPESYDLTIRTRIDENDFDFYGIVKIEIIVIESTNSIILHQRFTSVDEVELEEDGNAIAVDQHAYNETLQFLNISVTNYLRSGSRYTLRIKYNGTLREDYVGFYRTSYLNDDGIRVWLATTQFQAAEARHAFPCYDEPGIKVPITIRLIHGQSYSALSNMPVNFVNENEDGTVTTEFVPTPPISTYIVAFMVSDYSYISNPESDIPQRAFARPNNINSSEFILNVGNQMMDELVNYFGVNYSLPKLDQVGIPNFIYGAMENWGLVKYREDYFFYNESMSLYSSKFSTVRVVGHEFVHQWFGNLVSPSWWSYLWLNEGFARYFEYVGIKLTQPSWELGDNYFVSRVLQTVFQADALETSPAMNRYINHPDDIDSQFSLMTSNKAACVIRMFLNVVTEATFLKGIRRYLNDRSYSVANENDLFYFIDAAAREDNTVPTYINVTLAMSSWTNQGGFPLLSVTRNYVDSPSQIVTFSQQRYMTQSFNKTMNATWWIPINYVMESNPNFEETQPIHWFPQQETLTIYIPGLNASDWLMINVQETGYFRVLYDEENYKLLSDAILRNISQFHMLNRAQLIDDTYDFVRAGKLRFDTFLNIARFLEHDHDYSSWYPAITAFTTIELRYSGSENYTLFRNYLRRLIEHLYNTVGVRDITDEPLIRKYVRPIAIQWACKLGVVNCQMQAINELQSVIETEGDFHQNVRDVSYCAALRNGSSNEFYDVWNRMQRSDMSGTRNLLINALGCSSTPTLLLEYLNSSLPSLNSNNVSYTFAERIYVFNSVYQNSIVGLELAVQFLMENNYEAFTTYGADNLQNIYIGMAGRIGGNGLIIQFKILLHEARTNGLIYENIFDDANRRLSENKEWLDTHGEIISKWLLQSNYQV